MVKGLCRHDNNIGILIKLQVPNVFTKFCEDRCLDLEVTRNRNCTNWRRIKTSEHKIPKIIGPNCTILEQDYLHPLFDICDDSLPIEKNFPKHIFDAIK